MKLSPKLEVTTASQLQAGDLVLRSPGARSSWGIVAARASGAGAATYTLLLEQPERNLQPLVDDELVLSAGADYLVSIDHSRARVGRFDAYPPGMFVLFAGGLGAAIWLNHFDQRGAQVFDLQTRDVVRRTFDECSRGVGFTKWKVGLDRTDRPSDPYEWIFTFDVPNSPGRDS